MALTLGIEVAVRAAHQATLARLPLLHPEGLRPFWPFRSVLAFRCGPPSRAVRRVLAVGGPCCDPAQLRPCGRRRAPSGRRWHTRWSEWAVGGPLGVPPRRVVNQDGQGMGHGLHRYASRRSIRLSTHHQRGHGTQCGCRASRWSVHAFPAADPDEHHQRDGVHEPDSPYFHDERPTHEQRADHRPRLPTRRPGGLDRRRSGVRQVLHGPAQPQLDRSRPYADCSAVPANQQDLCRIHRQSERLPRPRPEVCGNSGRSPIRPRVRMDLRFRCRSSTWQTILRESRRFEWLSSPRGPRQLRERCVPVGAQRTVAGQRDSGVRQ